MSNLSGITNLNSVQHILQFTQLCTK